MQGRIRDFGKRGTNINFVGLAQCFEAGVLYNLGVKQ